MRVAIPPSRPGLAWPVLRFAAAGVCLAASLHGCGGDSDTPTDPSPPTAVTIEMTSPSSGGAAVIPPTYPYNQIGGVVMPKGSAVITVRTALSLANASSFAQLSIFLVSNASGTEYCAENAPDSPTWRNLPAGWTTNYTVTGFQVFRVPCTVIGVRAILHSRDDPHAGGPPRPEQIIAETTLPVSIQIRLQ